MCVCVCLPLLTTRWALRKKEKSNGGGGSNGRREDVLDRLLAGIDEREWGPAAIKQLRDEVGIGE